MKRKYICPSVETVAYTSAGTLLTGSGDYQVFGTGGVADPDDGR